mmetsp:Transcript_103495/g.194740  ORF Transcript_103495/g.194740 Transcript_103495/m.194740 type:complete len:110 (-) Transcript_103495:22-351(-)
MPGPCAVPGEAAPPTGVALRAKAWVPAPVSPNGRLLRNVGDTAREQDARHGGWTTRTPAAGCIPGTGVVILTTAGAQGGLAVPSTDAGSAIRQPNKILRALKAYLSGAH